MPAGVTVRVERAGGPSGAVGVADADAEELPPGVALGLAVAVVDASASDAVPSAHPVRNIKRPAVRRTGTTRDLIMGSR
jgi:hypothetical protein